MEFKPSRSRLAIEVEGPFSKCGPLNNKEFGLMYIMQCNAHSPSTRVGRATVQPLQQPHPVRCSNRTNPHYRYREVSLSGV